VVNISPFIDTSVHGIRGGSRPQDLEAAFQMLYLNFTAPNADQAALDLLKRQLNSLIVNRQQNPGAVFADRVRALNTGNSRYVRSITPEALGALKLDVMRQAYRDRFANAADFTFFIVGTFKEADIVPHLERYVASLPSTGSTTGTAGRSGIASRRRSRRFGSRRDASRRARSSRRTSPTQVRTRTRRCSPTPPPMSWRSGCATCCARRLEAPTVCR
jgi:hypothetical protein